VLRKRVAVLVAMTVMLALMLVAPAYGDVQGAGVQTCAVPASLNAQGTVGNVAGGPNDVTGNDSVSPPENTYGSNQGQKAVNVDHPSEVGQATALGPPEEGQAINCQSVPGSEPRGSL
jgi:hypothetical protein